MTLLEKLEQAAQWISDLFAKIPSHIKEYAATAIGITDKIEAALEGTDAIIIAELIPGDWAEPLREKAVALLSEFLAVLQAIEAVPTTLITDDKSQAELAKIGSKLIALQDGNELKQHIYDNYFQTIFSKTQK